MSQGALTSHAAINFSFQGQRLQSKVAKI